MQLIEVSPIEIEMNIALEKENVTEKAIDEMEKQFLPITLEYGDKEGYISVVETHKKLKKFEGIIVDICKKGREDAILTQKSWVAKEKSLKDRVGKITLHIGSLRKSYEAEEEKIKEEKRRLLEANLIKRQSILFKMGVELTDNYFVLEDVSVDILMVKESNDDTFENTILPMFIPIFEKKESARIEEENRIAEQKRKADEAEQLLKKQQDDLAQKEKEFKEKMLAFENQLREVEKEKERVYLAAKKAKEDSRITILEKWGMSYNFQKDAFVFSNAHFSFSVIMEDIKNMSDESWEDTTRSIGEDIAKAIIKEGEDLEKKRIDDIEKAKEMAIEIERERLRKKAEDDMRIEQEALQKEAEIIEQANDKQKWKLFIDRYFKEIKFPEMKNKKYREFVEMAKEKIEEIKSL